VVAAGALSEPPSDWDRAKTAAANPPGWVEAVPGASHAGLLGERHADAVVRAVLRVLEAARAS
jgi:hypothetical protein